jgi:hypothetical protein
MTRGFEKIVENTKPQTRDADDPVQPETGYDEELDPKS